MVEHINLNHELYEVLNAFPCLKDVIESMGIDLTNLNEGFTVNDFFSQKGYEESEIEHILKKLNYEVNNFLKTGEINKAYSSKSRDKEEELGIEMIA